MIGKKIDAVNKSVFSHPISLIKKDLDNVVNKEHLVDTDKKKYIYFIMPYITYIRLITYLRSVYSCDIKYPKSTWILYNDVKGECQGNMEVDNKRRRKWKHCL